MAITDEALRTITEALEPRVRKIGLTRKRGGAVRGTAWAEMSGRPSERGGWYEMRLHRKMDDRLQATILTYQPLHLGGRVIKIGEASYDTNTKETRDALIADVHEWLDKIEQMERATR
jgi:hypothetical protein